MDHPETQNIVNAFKDARLSVHIDTPAEANPTPRSLADALEEFGRNSLDMARRRRGFTDNEDIFQMSIESVGPGRHAPGRSGQVFFVRPGNHGNKVKALDSSKKHQQVLLFVQEPRREFTARFAQDPMAAQLRGLQQDLSRQMAVDPAAVKPLMAAKVGDGDKLPEVNEVKMETHDKPRIYLVGKDETHYFTCEVPKEDPEFGVVNSVEKAHRALMPEDLRNVKDLKRQGEWFFKPATQFEKMRCERSPAVPNHPIFFATSGLPPSPHYAEWLCSVADEVAVREMKEDWMQLYAWGDITHERHEPLHLPGPHKIKRNKEIHDPQNRALTWVD